MESFSLDDEFKPKSKNLRKCKKWKICNVMYKLFIVLCFSLAILFFVAKSSKIINKIDTLLDNANNIVKNSLPDEINYYHNLVNDHSDTIKQLENTVDNLLNNISTDIDYYNEVIRQHNETITILENKLELILNAINDNFNNQEFIDEIKNIVFNINNITSDLDVDQLQKDIHTIACALNKALNNGDEC